MGNIQMDELYRSGSISLSCSGSGTDGCRAGWCTCRALAMVARAFSIISAFATAPRLF